MYTNDYYYIMTFDTTTAVIEAEQYIKEICPIAVMPVPREITSGCGLALRFLKPEGTDILNFCKSLPFSGNLYKMQVVKENGQHPIEKLLSF